MTSLQNPHQSQQWNGLSARHFQSVLMAGALGAASLIATPVLARNQYCNLPNGANCSSNSNLQTGDTYFWAPATKPTDTPPFTIQTLIVMGGARFPARTNITLRGPSGWAMNATGTFNPEILIGSLGSNKLRGGGGKDTYVVGNAPSVIPNLPTCTSASGNTADCVIPQSPSSSEGDTIILDANSTEVIYINRCLQVTANGTPGLGGNQITQADPAPSTLPITLPITPPFPAYSGSDAAFATSCGQLVTSLRQEGLWSVAQRGREALQAPWERWWPASTAWTRAVGWLQQTMTALLQGPKAIARPSSPVEKPRARVPIFPGVARLIEAGEGNFLRTDRARGDTIVVDSGAATFNGRALSSMAKVGRVYGQLNNSDPIPLNRGIVFVYHQQMGILASYGTDRYPYGTKQNPGTVVTQLVLSDGRALPAQSIDSVATLNLSRSSQPAPGSKSAPPANLLRPPY